MKEGDTVLVPRTGGGSSLGTILAISSDSTRALVEFVIGDTFRGQLATEKQKAKIGTKLVDINRLRPLQEAL